MSYRDLKKNLLSSLSCPKNMYMHFWQYSFDNFMRNRAYIVSQILSHRVIVQNNMSFTFGGGGKFLWCNYWENTKNTYVRHVGHLRVINLI